MANKEFQVRHGLAVNNNVLVANTVTGNVSIGSNTASYKLDVAGTVRANRLRTWNSASNADWDAFEILSIGASSILKSYGDETGLILRSEAGNIILADDRGNVGIGTSSPQAALDVYNASRYALRLTGPVSNGPIFDLYRQNTRTAFIETDSSNNFLLAAVQQGPSLSLRTNGGAGPVDRLVITTDGNVGIGTSAPANKLDVRGTLGLGQSSNSALNILTVTSSIVGADNHSTTFAGPVHGTNDVITFDLNRGGGAYGAFDVKFNGTSRFFISGGTLNGDGYINLPTNTNFVFKNNNTERMRFDANGNLGIGTTTPLSKLSVYGTGSSGMGLFISYGHPAGWGLSGAGEGGLGFITSTSNTFRFHTSGYNYPLTLDGSTVILQGSGATGNVGIGTTTPSAKLHVAGDAIFTGNVTISGNTSYMNTQTLLIGDNLITLNADIPSNTPGTEDAGIEVNRGSLGNASFIWDETSDKWDIRANNNNLISVLSTGRVGIGTTTPSDSLHIVGVQTIVQSASAGYTLWKDATPTKAWQYTLNGNDSTFRHYDGSSWIERMRIDALGNVGIGVNNTAGWKLRVHSNTSSTLMLQNDVGLGNRLYFVDQGWQSEIEGNNGNLKFKTGGTVDRMTIDHTGNIGVGTTPGDFGVIRNFEIANTSGSQIRVRGTNVDVHMQANDVAGVGILGNRSNHALMLKTNDAERMRIDTSGNVAIGTTSTSARLQVTGTSNSSNVLYLNVGGNYLRANGFSSGSIRLVGFENNVLIGNEFSSGDLALIAGGSERVRVTSGGSVGIGTSPSHALHVNGNALVSGSIYNNDIRDTGGNAKLNWVAGAGSGINAYGPIHTDGTYTFLSPTFSSAPRGSIVLGDGMGSDVLAFNPPSTAELYNGNTWSSTTVTDSIKALFQGKHSSSFSTYEITTANAGVRFTWTSSEIPLYIFLNALLISSQTQGNSVVATLETSTDSGSTWTTVTTTNAFNTWPGYTIHNLVTNLNASSNRMRISFVRSGASNGNSIWLGQIGLINSYQAGNRLFNWNVNRWLGVGTISNGIVTPQSPLDVAGAIVARSGAITTAVASTSIIDNNAGIARFISRGPDASTNGTFQLISTRSDGTSVGNRLTIDAGGRVGLGTTSPGSRFVIVSGGEGVSIDLSAGIQSFGFNRNAADGAVYNASSSAWQFTARDTYFALEGYNGVNTFSTASSSIITATKTNAFVGIGTTSPSQRLTVAGGQILVGPTDSGNSYINFYSTSYRVGANSGLEIQTGGTDVVRFLRGSTETARIDGDGNVGIGTTSPTGRLDVWAVGTGRAIRTNPNDLGYALSTFNASAGNAEQFNIKHNLSAVELRNERGQLNLVTNTANPIVFYTANTAERMRIHTNGNVGIGNTAPDALLHVAGTTILGGDTVTTMDVKFSRLLGGIRAINHWFTQSANSPWYLFGQNMTWTGERTGTVDPTHAHRPYYEAYAPVVGYKEFGFANVSSGSIASSNLIANMVLTNTGNVGMGSLAPAEKLHVVGNILLPQSTANTGAIVGVASSDNFTTSGVIMPHYGMKWASPNDSVGPTGFLSAYYGLRFFVAGSEAVRIDANTRNIGIGTTAPSTKLHVKGTVNGNEDLLTLEGAQTGTGVTGILFKNSGSPGNSGAIRFGPTAQDPNGGRSLTFLGDVSGTLTERMRIDSTGNVAIGQASAPERLTVFRDTDNSAEIGRAHVGYIGYSDYAGFSHVDQNSGSNYALLQQATGQTYLNSASGTPIYFRHGNGDQMILSAGNLGIGTTSPDTFLHIYKNNTAAHQNYIKIHMPSWAGSAGYNKNIVWNDGAGDVAGIGAYFDGTSVNFSFHSMYNGGLKTNANSVMNIMGTGNVGIGTTTPAYKLQVNGSFAANTKSFVIDHPTKPGMKLRHGSLEGPENGVYVRGKTKEKVIELPEYWRGLIDSSTITVQLTAIGRSQNLYVVDVSDNRVYIDSENYTDVDCYYYIQAERKDVEKLVVEY